MVNTKYNYHSQITKMNKTPHTEFTELHYLNKFKKKFLFPFSSFRPKTII